MPQFDIFGNEIPEKEEKPKKEVKKETKKEVKAKASKASKDVKYKYPFQMYFGHEYRDMTHIFEEGKEYTTDEITKALVEHDYKEFRFANEIEWEYFEDENCLYPKLKVGNRG